MASEHWSKIASRALSDHELHLFYEFDGIALSGPTLTLGDLATAKAAWLPPDQVPALRERYGDEKVWDKAIGDTAGDLYQHFADIIDGRSEELASRWTLSGHAKDLITSADLYRADVPRGGRVRKRMDIYFGKRQSERLRAHAVAPRALAVVVQSLTLHVFDTGKSLAHLVAVIEPAAGGPIKALELLETVVSLARISELLWRSAKDESAQSERFDLNLLVRHFVAGGKVPVRKGERTKTWTYARFAEPLPPAETDLFGYYLAGHYTTDYVVDPSAADVERVARFETVRHTIALEGAATLVSPDRLDSIPEFLEAFKTATFQKHHIPIALLALHEYAFLVDRSTWSAAIREEESKESLDTLEQLIKKSLRIRLHFRCSQVSNITMHNQLNQAFRNVLGLDRLLNEFATDVTEIDAFLRAEQDRNAEQRFRRLTIVGGASLAGFAGATILTSILKVLFEVSVAKHLIASKWIGLPFAAEALGLLGGIILFFLALWVLHQRGPAPHGGAGGKRKESFLWEWSQSFLSGT